MRFSITGDNNNILTKTGKDGRYMGTICINELDKSIKSIFGQLKFYKHLINI